jgi:hypothetical protein
LMSGGGGYRFAFWGIDAHVLGAYERNSNRNEPSKQLRNQVETRLLVLWPYVFWFKQPGCNLVARCGVAARGIGDGNFAPARDDTDHRSSERPRLSLRSQRGLRKRASAGSSNCGKALWNVWAITTRRLRSGGAGGEGATETRPDLPAPARAPVVPVPVPWRGSAVRPR